MKCAYLENIYKTDSFNTIAVSDALQEIKSGKYQKLIDKLPDSQTNKKSYDVAKKKLPAFALNGEFSGSVTNDGFSESNGLLHIDIDGIDEPAKLKHEMARDIPEIYALWESPSGKGLKGLLRIADDLIHNDSDFKKAFSQINSYLVQFDIQIDKACKDVRRLCFVSSDPDIYINENAPAFMFDMKQWSDSDKPKPLPTKPTATPTATHTKSTHTRPIDYPQRIKDIILNAGTGNYHHARLRAAILAGGLVAGELINEADASKALEDASNHVHTAHGDDGAVRQSEGKTLYDGYQRGLTMPITNDTDYHTQAAREHYTPLSELPSKQPRKPRKRAFTPIHELIKNRKVLSWVIRGYFPLESTCCVFGESGAGKSFLALDMALHIATGTDWQGHKTKQGAVFYVAGEGNIGITARCHAWSLHNSITLEESTPFYCTDGAIQPQDDTQSAALVEDITHWINSTGVKPMVIVFDTLARCFVGEENSSTDAGAYIAAIDELKHRFKCCVVSVHHTGKDSSKGGRGSSAFKGAWDMEHALSADKDSGIKKLETTKAKDIQTPTDKAFRLEQLDTGWRDDDGEPVTSAVCFFTECEAKQSRAKPLNARNRDVLNELHKAIEQSGIEPTSGIIALFPDSPHNIPAKIVHGDKWRDLAFAVIDVDCKKTTPFNRCKDQLKEAGKIGFYDGYYWLAND